MRLWLCRGREDEGRLAASAVSANGLRRPQWRGYEVEVCGNDEGSLCLFGGCDGEGKPTATVQTELSTKAGYCARLAMSPPLPLLSEVSRLAFHGVLDRSFSSRRCQSRVPGDSSERRRNCRRSPPCSAMEMKKIACVVLLAAALATAVLAGDAASPTPAPTNGSSIVVLVGSLVGATFLSFFAYYLQ
ncbi:hypothetical protein Taro_031245 [Colocasia esculenta]|uniref:Uncharacterized protein n=1 Tax=Colocasia esculenta TaxID=4460 RepID=A0A843VRE1_COLES|nr:hypothetical protein [Colocasia esculenta]